MAGERVRNCGWHLAVHWKCLWEHERHSLEAHRKTQRKFRRRCGEIVRCGIKTFKPLLYLGSQTSETWGNLGYLCIYQISCYKQLICSNDSFGVCHLIIRICLWGRQENHNFPISHVQNWGTVGYEINLCCIAGKERERILKYIFSLISRQI